MRFIVTAIVGLALSVAAGGVLAEHAPDTGSQASQSADPAFVAWLTELKAEALAKGITPAVVEQALGTVDLLPIVVERDRAQAEFLNTLDRYLARHVNKRTVATGREMAARHKELLARISAKYGVQARFIVAVWGLESNFGQFTGVRPTISALATLAYDQRRAAYFRGELFDALRILDRGDIDLASMKGSWAGAMGQPQFMPSSYLRFADDFDSDGRRDIWASPADVFASIANYLKAQGWVATETWGREVKMAKDAAARVKAGVAMRASGCDAARRLTERLPLPRWQELGVRLPGNKPLPKADLAASLLTAGSRCFLVYGNYDAILGYNCAHAYAVSVGMLADRIGG